MLAFLFDEFSSRFVRSRKLFTVIERVWKETRSWNMFALILPGAWNVIFFLVYKLRNTRRFHTFDQGRH